MREQIDPPPYVGAGPVIPHLRGWRVLPLGLAIVVNGAGCNRPRPASDPPSSSAAAPALSAGARLVTLERTPCYGTCPVYNVTLMSDGNVRFEGIRNVSAIGMTTWRVSADSAAAIFRFADSVQFASLADRFDFGEPGCSPYIADLPGFAVTVESAGVPKRVYADGGCPNIPRALAALPPLIDRLARVESAVGKP